MIDPGIWDRLFRPTHPPGFTAQRDRFLLRVADADLRALGSVDGDLDAAPVLGHRERAHMPPDPKFTARASSTRAPRGRFTYSASNVLDGDPATVWCADRSAPGTAPWIELHATRIDRPHFCPLRGYVLVPGNAKDAATWARDARVDKLRLSPCDDLDGGKTIRVEPSDRYDTSAIELDALDSDPILVALRKAPIDQETVPVKDYCLRLTVEETSGASDASSPVCISEFRPITNCE